MKKIIITTLTLLSIKGFSGVSNEKLFAAPTYTKIVKSDGGLFGYKYVDETTTSNGSGGTNQILACSNPGWNRCRFTSTAKSILTQTDLDQIESLVTDQVASVQDKKTEGQLVYNASYLVVYKYHLGPDDLTYEIFTKDEASAAGYTF